MRGVRRLAAGAVAFAVLGAGAAPAADYSDPTWPCIQPKVPELSAGLMWPEPLEPEDLGPERERQVAALAGELVLERVAEAEADERISAFAETLPPPRGPVMGQVFLRVFEHLARERRRIIAGIATLSLEQAGLAQRVREARAEMQRLEAEGAPDFDRIDALEEQIAWDERIWRDRQQSLTYVCETPVLIEKRLYRLAQALQRAGRE